MPLGNLREVCGQRSRFGGRVQAGRLFRSGQPTSIEDTPPPGVNLIIDLRYPAERRHSGSWPEAQGRRIIFHDADRIGDSPQEAVKALAPTTIEEVDDYYESLYRDLPFDEVYRPLFGRILNTLADHRGGVLIHCSQGKDRTALLIALLLEILGVDRDDILADFILSGTTKDLGPGAGKILARFRKDYGYEASLEVLIRLMCIQPSYLIAAYRVIEDRFGSVEEYLNDIGVHDETRDRLRISFLSA